MNIAIESPINMLRLERCLACGIRDKESAKRLAHLLDVQDFMILAGVGRMEIQIKRHKNPMHHRVVDNEGTSQKVKRISSVGLGPDDKRMYTPYQLAHISESP